MNTDFQVVYIGGAGRSGTTLLELMLGEQPGVFAAGELTYIWQRGLVEAQLCGCSRPLTECPLWRDILADLQRHTGPLNLDALAQTRNQVCALSSLPLLLIPTWQPPGFRRRLAHFVHVQEQLYRAIHRVTGATVITDSTKYPSEAWMLTRLMSLQSLVIHVVRDSRGVSYSWTRKRRRPEIHWKTELMPRYPTLQTAGAWDAFNLFFEGLSRLGEHVVRVRYEDLVRAPAPTLLRLLATAGLHQPLRHVDARQITLTQNHTSSGNPLRFKRGPLELRLDDAWRDELKPFARAAITAATLPLLKHYDYAL